MTSYFYFDSNNQKHGPYSELQQLQELADQGIITPMTPMETDGGHKGMAGQIPVLKFNATSSSLPVQASRTVPVPQSVLAKELFCTNCGTSVPEQAVACMSCGARPVGHKKFCGQCGVGLNPEQVVCIKCGAEINSKRVSRSVGGNAVAGTKSKMTAGILAILLGGTGTHKFYMGSWGWGLLFLCNPLLIVPTTAFLSFISMGLLSPLLMLSVLFLSIQGGIGLVEGIIYLTMSEEIFAEKYPPETKSAFRW